MGGLTGSIYFLKNCKQSKMILLSLSLFLSPPPSFHFPVVYVCICVVCMLMDACAFVGAQWRPDTIISCVIQS